MFLKECFKKDIPGGFDEERSSCRGSQMLPLTMAQSLGEKARLWLKLGQEKPKTLNRRPVSNDWEDILNLEVSPEYKTQVSPQVRLPYHLRSKIIRKIYVPPRAKSYRHSHYAVPLGRPVPVPSEMRSLVIKSHPKKRSLKRVISRRIHSYDVPRVLPDYLFFRRTTSTLSNSNNYSKRELKNNDSDGDGTSSDGGYNSDSENNVISSECLHNNCSTAATRTNSCEDNNCIKFSVHREKLSPKILEVVTKLREASPVCHQNDLNKKSSGDRDFHTTGRGRHRKEPHNSNITRSCRDIRRGKKESASTNDFSSSHNDGIFRAVPLRWSCHDLLERSRTDNARSSSHSTNNLGVSEGAPTSSESSFKNDTIDDIYDSLESINQSIKKIDLKVSFGDQTFLNSVDSGYLTVSNDSCHATDNHSYCSVEFKSLAPPTSTDAPPTLPENPLRCREPQQSFLHSEMRVKAMSRLRGNGEADELLLPLKNFSTEEGSATLMGACDDDAVYDVVGENNYIVPESISTDTSCGKFIHSVFVSQRPVCCSKFVYLPIFNSK